MRGSRTYAHRGTVIIDLALQTTIAVLQVAREVRIVAR
jgi:hypothetical protein